MGDLEMLNYVQEKENLIEITVMMRGIKGMKKYSVN